jgi:hypothetical protein
MPKRRRLPKDVEILVDGRESCKSFEEAAAMAVQRGISDGMPHDIDVNFYSERGARAFGGDDAVESYREDPEASASDRVVVKVEYVGRVA